MRSGSPRISLRAARLQHCEFERARPYGLGGWEASRPGRVRASTLPMPPGRSRRTLNLTEALDQLADPRQQPLNLFPRVVHGHAGSQQAAAIAQAQHLYDARCVKVSVPNADTFLS
jgi:hypothetical protein